MLKSRTALAAVALAVLAVAGAAVPGASAANAKHFSAAFTPKSVSRGTTAAETLTVTNTSSARSGATIGVVNVTVPDGFSVSSAHVTSPDGWNARISEGVIQLSPTANSDSRPTPLGPGSSLTVAIQALVSCDVPNSNTWPANASTNSDSNDFSEDAPTVLSGKGACSFSLNVPSPQTAGSPIDVVVRTLDANGQPTCAFDGTATVGGNFNDATDGTAPSYSDELDFSRGVASDQDLATAYLVEDKRFLTVSSDSISGKSNKFNVGPGAPFGLAFDQEPIDVAVNQAMYPSMLVDVLDQWGNLETGLNQMPVSLSIWDDPADGAELGGTTTQYTVGGVARFDDISIDEPGNGFSLRAGTPRNLELSFVNEDGGINATISSLFNVFDTVTCEETSCSATNAEGNTTVTINGAENPGTQIAFGPSGAQFNCDGVNEPAFGSIADIIPAGGNTERNPLQVTFRVSASVLGDNPNASNFDLCYARDGTTYSSVPMCNRSNFDDNGNGDNNDDDSGCTQFPCVQSKFIDPQTGDLVVVLLITSDDPYAGMG